MASCWNNIDFVNKQFLNNFFMHLIFMHCCWKLIIWLIFTWHYDKHIINNSNRIFFLLIPKCWPSCNLSFPSSQFKSNVFVQFRFYLHQLLSENDINWNWSHNRNDFCWHVWNRSILKQGWLCVRSYHSSMDRLVKSWGWGGCWWYGGGGKRVCGGYILHLLTWHLQTGPGSEVLIINQQSK